MLFGISIISQILIAQNPGSAMENFGSAPGFSYSVFSSFNYGVYTTVIQPDGKIIVGGRFTKYNGLTENYITRLNIDGTKDNTFNSQLDNNIVNESVNSITLQSDGKILVGGDFISYNGITSKGIVRLNADGTIDNSFISGSGFIGSVLSIALQSDGKIIVGGDFISYNGISSLNIVRLNTDGTIDNSFIYGTGFFGRVNCTAIQSDGKILVGGQFSSYNGVTENDIIRLNSDGTRDNSFISGSGFNLDGTGVYSIALQSDGKILVGGVFDSYNGVGGEQGLIRLNNNGTKDYSLSTSSGSTIIGFNNAVKKIEIQPDGKILVGGDFTRYKGLIENNIIRLNTDGSKDITFNLGTVFSGSVNAISIQNNGKIILGGGFRQYNEFTANLIIRLETNGARDSIFNNNPITGFDNVIYSTVYQPDGKIIVGGAFTSYYGLIKNRIIRLNVDGTIDNTFNVGIGFDNDVRTIALQSDGKILVGGAFGLYNGVDQRSLIRLNSDGSKDISFATFNNPFEDFQLPNCAGCIAPIFSIVFQPDGKILVGGNFSEFGTNRNSFLTRLNADGTEDNLFSTGYTFDDSVYSVCLQPDGKILVGGKFTENNGEAGNKIIRLNSDGSIDNTFNVGTGFINFQGQSCFVNSIILQPDGKILVGGKFVSYNGNIKSNFVRLNSNGTFDNTFAPLMFPNSEVLSIGLQLDGKIIVGGKFTTYNSNNENYLMRLNIDGTKDTNFNIGIGFNNFISSITVGSNSKILVGGAFTTYMQSNASSYLIELNGSSVLSNSEIANVNSTYYPNPVVDILNINSSLDFNYIKISDIQGQIIFQNLYNSKYAQINTSDFPSGIYIVNVESKGKKEAFKIIKK